MDTHSSTRYRRHGGELKLELELENTTPSGLTECAVCRGNDLGEIY